MTDRSNDLPRWQPSETPRAIRRASRGFTLVELLVVVAMIGVLAALAIVGYRKYIASAQSSEAQAVIQGIRASQEAHRAETLTYRDCTFGTYGDLSAFMHPRAIGDLDNRKASFIMANALGDCFRALNVQTDGPVRFSYGTAAGLPNANPNAVTKPSAMAQWPTFPATPADPWYIVLAMGDRDDDGEFAYALSSSFAGEVYVEDDTE